MSPSTPHSLLLPLLIGAWLLCAACPQFTAPPSPPDEPASRATVRVERPTQAPAPAPAPAPPPSQPQPAQETVSARHILLQYRGSTRASADVTRSKEQAEARIRQILRQARGGAEFTELAREHSDGPSGPNGGDLGSFPRGRMHPAFQEAAFALEVGEISDPVETPFGYHIIQRYE